MRSSKKEGRKLEFIGNKSCTKVKAKLQTIKPAFLKL